MAEGVGSHGTLAGTPVFKTGALNRSATLPNQEFQSLSVALDGDDLRALPLSLREANLARLLTRRPDGIFTAPFEQGEIGPGLFRAACNMG